MSESETGRQYDRWAGGRSISGRGYALLATVPGAMLINTPVFRLERNLILKPEQRLLDIGCGQGSLLQVIASRVPFERPPVGIDLSREMLARGHKASEDGSRGAIELARASANQIPFAEGSFDIVTCSYVLKHFDDGGLVALMSEALRVLKPGGFAVMWEFSPTRSRRLNTWHHWLLTRGVSTCNLRGFAQLAAAATAAGFEWVENAHLRPFLFPPIPRVSLVLGKAPEEWRQRTGPGRARRIALESRQPPDAASGTAPPP